ncbi:trypsin-like peptidase domain-containing protein [Dactylosporangium sp. CA-139066]|uniref:trypsin-like peptidase domain-containing protein n=1 Tax=Dactylosporangium sp. CA-139066 TaxID=3239930 RepID=UPI003D918276
MIDDVTARVVEVLRAVGGRGSGYAVGADLVLTAAHVVADDDEVFVVAGGKEELRGAVVWRHPTLDAALVRVPTRRWVGIGTYWATVSGVGPVPCTAIGYPRVQKTSDGVRVEEHIAGFIMPAAGRRIRRYALNVTSALPYESSRTSSPWSGMSGAAVLTGDGRHVLGVLVDDPIGFEPSRLEAVPVADLLASPGFAELVGAGPALLVTVMGEQVRPAGNAGRREQPGSWWRPGYIDQVGDIAPLQLLDRQRELDELVAWCTAGDEAYVWWQAEARAGKSALMAWFVLDPPPGVWVVSFFVTARYAGQADSTAFTDGLLEQLAAITGEQLPPVTAAAARDRLRRHLLAAAVTRAAEAGCRLVLLVDGLDEDCGSLPGSGLPSIAACLPKRPPDGLRVIVAGRPDPPIPADVALDHPLRTCRVRRLAPSPHAERVTAQAQRELDEVLAVDLDRHQGLGFDVLGLVTACGGGLHHRDLQQLTDQPAFKIDRLLHGLFGRTIAGRADPHTTDRVFLFTHETLRVQAIDRLGPDTLTSFRDRIHAWAGGYQRRGWPADTPAYLLRGYPRLLADLADVPRLVALATDPARHDRMLHATGGDAAALADIAAAFTLINAQSAPDLLAAFRLAWHRDRLTDRNSNTPTNLPAVWAALGQPIRAEALARMITDSGRQVQALIAVAAAVAGTGDQDRAEALVERAEAVARSITAPDGRALALSAVVTAVIGAGDVDRAEALARSITISYRQGWALSAVAAAVAGAGDVDRAEALARSITDPVGQAVALPGMAAAIAGAGDLDRAEALARSINDPYRQERVLSAVVAAVAGAGDLDRAEALARTITSPDSQAQALSAVVTAVAGAGDVDRAEALARSITDPYEQADALSAVAAAVAGAGDLDRAEALARSINDPYRQERVLSAVVAALAGAGDLDRAEALARTITSPDSQAQALSAAVTAVAGAGDVDRAEALARSITNPGQQKDALSAVAVALAGAGDLDRAEALARSITDPRWQAEALTAAAAAGAGDHDRAEALAERAEALARSITDPIGRMEALRAVAAAVAGAGEHDSVAALAQRAEALARSFTVSEMDWQALAFNAVVVAVAGAGDLDRAEALARSITDPYEQAHALSAVAAAVAGTGDLDRAEALARSITDPYEQADALSAVAAAVAGTGDLDRAEALAQSITNPYRQMKALTAVVAAVGGAGDHDRAEALAERAETLAPSIIDPDGLAQALISVAVAVAAAGAVDRAEALARSIRSPYRQMEALSAVVAAAAGAGDLDRAEALAQSITDPGRQVEALSAVVTAAAGAGERDRPEAMAERAQALAERAQAVARSITGPFWHDVDVLIEVVTAVARIGYLDLAETVARSIIDPDQQSRVLIEVVAAVAGAGDLDRAEALARSITDPDRQAEALSAVTAAVAGAGDPDRAEALARSITDPDQQSRVLIEVVAAVAGAGDPDRAEALARSITDPDRQARALTVLAERASPPRARSTIVRALAVGGWRIPLGALVRIEPNVIHVFADEWLGTQPSA